MVDVNTQCVHDSSDSTSFKIQSDHLRVLCSPDHTNASSSFHAIDIFDCISIPVKVHLSLPVGMRASLFAQQPDSAFKIH